MAYPSLSISVYIIMNNLPSMLPSFFRSIPLRDKVLFYESIANLLDGGVTLVSALRGFVGRLPA